jgi:hypothetical protein
MNTFNLIVQSFLAVGIVFGLIGLIKTLKEFRTLLRDKNNLTK